MRERTAATNGERARGRGPSVGCIAGRIPGRRFRGRRPFPSRGQMFRPVSTKPDLVAQEHELLARWREHRTFDRLRAQNAGGPRWSFLDGPITANNPMGVHHAWGRTYKDVFQRYPRDARRERALPERVRLPGPVGRGQRRARPRVHEQARHRGLRHRRVRLALQAARPDLRRPPDRAVDPARDVDGLGRSRRAPPAPRRAGRGSVAGPDDPGPSGPLTDTAEMLVGRLGHPELGGSYFTFSNENNDLIWGFLAECHRRGWIYKGHDSMPWCPRCGTGLSQMEMNEGYADREDPGLTVRFPLVDRPGEALLVWTTTPWTLAANVAAAVHPEQRLRQGSPGRRRLLGRQGDPQAVGRRRVRGRRREGRVGARRLAYTGPFDDLPAVAVRRRFAEADGYEHRVVPWNDVGEDEGTGIVHIAPGRGRRGLPARQVARAAGDRADRRGGPLLRGLRLAEPARRAARSPQEIIDDLERRGFFYHLEPYSHRYPHCWRCNTPLLFRLVDEWFINMGPVYDKPRSELTPDGGRREPALPDHGGRRPDPVAARRSAMSVSSTGC